jgi:hypothetical protein
MVHRVQYCGSVPVYTITVYDKMTPRDADGLWANLQKSKICNKKFEIIGKSKVKMLLPQKIYQKEL